MNKITTSKLIEKKQSGEKITCLTAYDASFAKIIDAAKTDIILIGDSLGTVIQGHNSTIPVSIDDMVYHTNTVSRVCEHALIVADMPFMSFTDITTAHQTAQNLLQIGGAHMVKIEDARLDIIRSLSENAVSVCVHLGLLPQSVHQYGGYKVQGKAHDAAQQMINDAIATVEAGAQLIVLECIPADLAHAITDAVSVPTIGIGAGMNCDGQVLVLYDLLGISINKIPKFAKNYLAETDDIQSAIELYLAEVIEGKFPTDAHSF